MPIQFTNFNSDTPITIAFVLGTAFLLSASLFFVRRMLE